jgi:hypothetical protein
MQSTEWIPPVTVVPPQSGSREIRIAKLQRWRRSNENVWN